MDHGELRESAPIYSLHGVRVRSEVRVSAAVAPAGSFDVDIALGEARPIPDAASNGRLLALFELPAGSSSLAHSDTGCTLRVHGLCDCEVDHGLERIRVHLSPSADPELAAVLIEGVLSMWLALRGNCVLHASAVQTDGGVIAFVGGSGMGKSTVAALACEAGARLVSDDSLRVEREGAQAWCFSGTTELRLRPSVAEAAELLGVAPRRSTLDHRLAITPEPATRGRLPLTAIVVPVCADGTDELRVERLRGADATRELLRFPRCVGWIEAEHHRSYFGVVSSLAAVVSVYRARLPWGPPFDPQLAEALLSELRPSASVPRDRVVRA